MKTEWWKTKNAHVPTEREFIQMLSHTISSLESDLADEARRTRDAEYDLEEMETRAYCAENNLQFAEGEGQRIADEMHEKVNVYRQNPVDVLDDFFREHGFLAARAAA